MGGITRIGTILGVEELEARVAPAAGLDLVTRSGVGYDFNGDGYWDVLTYDRQTGNLFVDLMNAAGEAEGAADKLGTHFIGQQKDASLELGGVGNWLGAGCADILWHSTATGDVVVWQMSGMTITGATVALGTTDTQWRIGGTSDFDGNGTSDLLWQHTATGDLPLWLMNGTTIQSSVTIGTADPDTLHVVATGDMDADGQADVLLENLDSSDVDYKALTGWLITPGDLSSHTVQDLGTVADAAHDYRMGGITKLQPDATSNILLRGVDSLANAAFVDWKLDPTLTPTPRQIYERAPIRHAFMTADAIAGLPLKPEDASDTLVAITPGNPDLTWKTFDIDGVPTDHVLLQTWTKYTSVNPDYGDVWCTVGYETKDWYASHDIATEDLYQRTTQLLGMPADTTKTYFAEFWVAPRPTPTATYPHASLWRPTPDPDYTNHSSTFVMPGVLPDPTYEDWYTDLVSVSYLPPGPGQWPGGYPWTRLGYTYDWGGDPYTHFGLSEFVVPQYTPVIMNDLILNDVYWGRIYGTVENVTAGQPLRYTDADGDRVTVTLRGQGSVEVILPDGGVGDAVAMNTTGTDVNSFLSISVVKAGRGDGETTVGAFKVGTFGDPASLGGIIGPKVDLGTDGEILVTGWVGRIHLDDILGRDRIAIGGSAAERPLVFRFDSVADLSVTSGTPIQRFSASQWQDTDGTKDEVKAPWVNTITILGKPREGIRGDFVANVTVTNGNSLGVSLNRLYVAGAITDSTIAYQRAAGTPECGWINVISAARWDTGSVTGNRLRLLNITGNNRHHILGDFGADVTMNGLNVSAGEKALVSVRIAADLTGGQWQVAGDVGRVVVFGSAANSQINVVGDLRRGLFLGGMTDSTRLTVTGETALLKGIGGQTNSTLNLNGGARHVYLHGGMNGALLNVTGDVTKLLCVGSIDNNSAINVTGNTGIFRVTGGIGGNSTIGLGGNAQTIHVFGLPGQASVSADSSLTVGQDLAGTFVSWGEMAGTIDITDSASPGGKNSLIKIMGDLSGDLLADLFGNVIIGGDFTGNIGRDNPGGTAAGVRNYLRVTGQATGTLCPDSSIFEIIR